MEVPLPLFIAMGRLEAEEVKTLEEALNIIHLAHQLASKKSFQREMHLQA